MYIYICVRRLGSVFKRLREGFIDELNIGVWEC